MTQGVSRVRWLWAVRMVRYSTSADCIGTLASRCASTSSSRCASKRRITRSACQGAASVSSVSVALCRAMGATRAAPAVPSCHELPASPPASRYALNSNRAMSTSLIARLLYKGRKPMVSTRSMARAAHIAWARPRSSSRDARLSQSNRRTSGGEPQVAWRFSRTHRRTAVTLPSVTLPCAARLSWQRRAWRCP